MEGTLVLTTCVNDENPSLPYIEYMTGIEGKRIELHRIIK